VTLTSLDDIRAARERVAPYVHRTPVMRCSALEDVCGGVELHLKAELFQKTGSFKPRGIVNKVLTLTPEERTRGVVSLSAGNAAAAVAYAGSIAGVRSTICMPATAVQAKVDATRAYGGEVVLVEGSLLDGFAKVRDERVLVVVHPFDDPSVVAGQGTLGLEIVEDVPDVEVVLVPVGGGGLISGVAAAIKQTGPGTRVIGIEPSGSNVMAQSLAAGEALTVQTPGTIADGLAPPMTGELNVEHVRAFVDEMVEVDDDAILASLKLVLTRAKLVAEPSAVVGIAALMAGVLKLAPGTRTVAVLSGGNLDLALASRL
jgi:threonine dehydratase